MYGYLKLTQARVPHGRPLWVRADHVVAMVTDIWGDGTGITRIYVGGAPPGEFDVIETPDQIMALIQHTDLWG